MEVIKAVVCNKSFYSIVLNKQKYTKGKVYFVIAEEGELYYFEKCDCAKHDWYFKEYFDDLTGNQKNTVDILYGKI